MSAKRDTSIMRFIGGDRGIHGAVRVAVENPISLHANTRATAVCQPVCIMQVIMQVIMQCASHNAMHSGHWRIALTYLCTNCSIPEPYYTKETARLVCQSWVSWNNRIVFSSYRQLLSIVCAFVHHELILICNLVFTLLYNYHKFTLLLAKSNTVHMHAVQWSIALTHVYLMHMESCGSPKLNHIQLP